MLTPDLVSKYIKPSNGIANKVVKRYVTTDIMQLVIDTDRNKYTDTKELSKHITYTSVEDLCRQIWELLRYRVTYKEDEPGTQLVKSPSALWHIRVGDCKSFSLFTGSILKNLGIPYSYRFVSFSAAPIPTHVYVVAHDGKKDIIIDAVWHSFNSEKQYSSKKDFRMEAGLYAVSGINGDIKKTVQGAKAVFLKVKETPAMKRINSRKKHEYRPGMLRIFSSHPHDVNMAVIKQRMEIERDIVKKARGVSGIGKVEHYNSVIGVIDEWIDATERNDIDALTGILAKLPEGSRERNYLESGLIDKIELDETIDGIGKISLKKIVKGAGKAVKATGKAVATGAKAVAKTTVKVVRAVESVVTRPLLEVALPSASPYFMYEFVDSKDLGPKAQKKQKKAHNLFKAIVNVTGVKTDTVKGIIRNGIMKRYKKSPENVIAEWKKTGNKKVSGIGAFDPATMSIILSALNQVVDLVRKVLGKDKVENVSKDDVPDGSDFETATAPRDGDKPSGSYNSNPDSVDNKQTGGICGGGRRS